VLDLTGGHGGPPLQLFVTAVSRLTFFCDLAETTTPLPHFWEHTVGSDHARMTFRDDCRRQLKRAHEELGFRHVRFPGLLSDEIDSR
jgi:xylan 1,4-beta-xylosidase